MMMMRRQTNANAYDGNIYIYIFRCFFCRAKLWQKITKTEVLQLHLSRMRSTWWKFFRWSVNFCDNCFGQRWEQRMGEQEEYNEKDFIWRKSVFFSLSHSIDKFFFPTLNHIISTGIRWLTSNVGRRQFLCSVCAVAQKNEMKPQLESIDSEWKN